MKKNLFFALMAVVGIMVSDFAHSQTIGTMTFTVKTKAYGGDYTPKNVVAIWLSNPSGTFVRTFKLMAITQKNKLVKWGMAASNNTTNAITGATLTSHQTHSVTWDCKNLSGSIMPNGNYTVWIEFTERNSTVSNPGPFTSVTFTKGPVSQHLTPAGNTYFENISLNWVVDTTVAVEKTSLQENTGFECYPNPFTSLTTAGFYIPAEDHVTLNVYDVKGSLVKNLSDCRMSPGSHYIEWNGTTANGEIASPGVYYVKFTAGNVTRTQKILFLK